MNEINKLIGLPVKLKGMTLYSHPRMPDTHDFLPFVLAKDLGGGKAGVYLQGSPNMYSVAFEDLESTDPMETELRKNVESILFNR